MSEPQIAFRAERISGWGMAVGGTAQVARPTTPEQVAAAMALVAQEHGSLALRGSGCSYGDASINTAGHVLDTSGMKRILRCVRHASSFPRIHGDAAVNKFRELKQRLDPQHLLQTDLSRRLGV